MLLQFLDCYSVAVGDVTDDVSEVYVASIFKLKTGIACTSKILATSLTTT
jgi:hypothetical protein